MKRKVAIFRSELLPLSETFIRDQANALTEWEPTLIGRKEIRGGLQTPRLKREILLEPDNTLARTLRYWTARPDPALVEKFRQMDADLVHVHFGTDATLIWPSVKAANLPMLITLHGYDINIYRWWWERGYGGLRRRIYPHRLLKMAQAPSVHFLAVSQAIRQRAIEYGIPAHKITVSHIGIDTSKFRFGGLPIEQRRNRILFVGRMVEKKAPLLLIEACAEVRKQIPSLELVMVGEGPLLEHAKQLAQRLSVPVEFLGALNSEGVLSQLHQACIFCLPSITAKNGDAEGLPISILEAMSCGVPTISSANGIDDFINESNGYKISENNLIELKEVLIYTLKNKDKLEVTSRFSTAYVQENFDLKLTSKKLESIYSCLAKNTSH